MQFLNFLTFNFKFDNRRDRLRNVLEAKRAAVTLASVVTSLNAISMTNTPANPTPTVDTNEAKKPSNVVNEGETTSPATPTMGPKKSKKKKKPANPTPTADTNEAKKPSAVVNEGETTSPAIPAAMGPKKSKKKKKKSTKKN